MDCRLNAKTLEKQWFGRSPCQSDILSTKDSLKPRPGVAPEAKRRRLLRSLCATTGRGFVYRRPKFDSRSYRTSAAKYFGVSPSPVTCRTNAGQGFELPGLNTRCFSSVPNSLRPLKLSVAAGPL